MALALKIKRSAVTVLYCIILFTASQVVSGAVYKVGDTAGWTTIGNVDYKHWAADKNFQVGDIIVFEYNPQFHNVMQVKHPDYRACNASSPISTHTTGNDSITITNRGHHLFMCGVPGHCQAGQKVDINVPRSPSVRAVPSPSGAPSTAPTVTTAVPAAAPSHAARSLSSTNMPPGWLFLFFAAMVCGLS